MKRWSLWRNTAPRARSWAFALSVALGLHSSFAASTNPWQAGADPRPSDDAEEIAAVCAAADTVVGGSSAANCPIGCTRAPNMTCSSCPSFFVNCSIFGGCDPLGVVQNNATPTLLKCRCMEGFVGNRCSMKENFNPFAVLGAGLFVCYICGWWVPKALFQTDNGGYANALRSWNMPEYGIAHIQGPNVDVDLLLMGFQFLQLGAAAFAESVPWPYSSPIPKWLRAPALDMPDILSGFEVDLGFTPQILGMTLVGSFVTYHLRPAMPEEVLESESSPSPSFFRRNASRASDVLLIPATKTSAAVFFGCTYLGGDSLNFFDADSSLSCWRGWWWAYVPLSSMLIFMALVFGRTSSLIIGDITQSSTPATMTYAMATIASKMGTTCLAVAVGTWHPILSNVVIMLAHIALVLYLLVKKPFVHAYLNRLSIYGEVYNVFSYGTAVLAVVIDDPLNEISITVFTYVQLLVLGAYLGVEAVEFRKYGASPGDFYEVYQMGEDAYPSGCFASEQLVQARFWPQSLARRLPEIDRSIPEMHAPPTGRPAQFTVAYAVGRMSWSVCLDETRTFTLPDENDMEAAKLEGRPVRALRLEPSIHLFLAVNDDYSNSLLDESTDMFSVEKIIERDPTCDAQTVLVEWDTALAAGQCTFSEALARHEFVRKTHNANDDDQVRVSPADLDDGELYHDAEPDYIDDDGEPDYSNSAQVGRVRDALTAGYPYYTPEADQYVRMVMNRAMNKAVEDGTAPSPLQFLAKGMLLDEDDELCFISGKDPAKDTIAQQEYLTRASADGKAADVEDALSVANPVTIGLGNKNGED